METTAFYANLTSFSDFGDMTDDRHFSPIPNDWFMVAADVKESTKAIQEGRYKDVNTVGAATIAAVSNVMEKEDFPYDFAGDGATLAVPPHRINAVLQALGALRALSRTRFGLVLRVGAIAVSELTDEDVQVEVAKFELARGMCIAIFRGGGLAQAERRIKENGAVHEVEESLQHGVSLSHLSCRWNAIPNQHGRILSMLVLARSEDTLQVYQNVLAALDRILDGGLEKANPVNVSAMSYKSLWECLADERRYHASVFSAAFVARFLEICVAVLVFKWNFRPPATDPDHYLRAIPIHSDYRKFADMFRAVLDCSPKSISAIRAYLSSLYEKGDIYFGLHESDTSLMTCYVNSTADGQHVHFIDGGEGGYTLAAVQLKNQIKGQG